MSENETALRTARDVLLFHHEMGGYAPEDVVTAVRLIDAALGLEQTPFKNWSEQS